MDYRKFGWSTGRYLKPDQLSAVYVSDPEIVQEPSERLLAILDSLAPSTILAIALAISFYWR